MNLSTQTVDIVKATAPVVKENASTITKRFYQIMLNGYPEVRPYFNSAHQGSGKQAEALANAVVAYALNIDKLQNLGPVVNKIVAKHVALDIKAEHYPIVGACLLQAIAEILGEAITDEVAAAWSEAYNFLADILICAEEKEFTERAAEKGGWRGERSFTICRIEKESDVISSFYLKPTDGKDILDFIPGQYICLVATVNGEAIRRTYSLSDAPNNEYYRISVKREEGGKMSNFLHADVGVGSELMLLPPAGEFVLAESERPLVLLTAGVGITPAISMVQAAVKTSRPIQFIHAAINGSTHAFKDMIDGMSANHHNLEKCYIYSSPEAGDSADHTGYITEEILASYLPQDKDVDLYFLGPKGFMQQVRNIARNLKIADDQVRFEFFGPLEDI